MNIEQLKQIATSSHSQSFVSIEAWELLELIERIAVLEKVISKTKEHSDNLTEYLDGAACIGVCDSYGICFKCSVDTSAVLIENALKQSGETTK